MATRSRSTINIGSQEVVSISTRSLLEQQNHADKVQTTESNPTALNNIVETVTGRVTGTNIIKSLMPEGVTLNALGTGAIIDGLRDDVIDANAAKKEVRGQQEIPTADYVVRNSFKVGSKLLIKIEPTTKTTKLPDNQPNLVFNKFSLQAIAESDAERYQLQETFEDEVLYLFGRRPRVWTMQGIVLNGRRAPDADEANEINPFNGQVIENVRQRRLKKDMDWANRLLMDWENYYRGSKSVEARSRTYLAYDDSVIEATLLELVMARNAQVPTSVNATLTFVVHQRSFLGQEYIEGVSPANLKDLIEKTNAAGAFEDKIKPSDLSAADIELAEVNRQQLGAEENLREKQVTAQEALEEENRIQEGITQAQSEYQAAIDKSKQADEDIAEAQMALPYATDQATIDNWEKQIDEAQHEKEQAYIEAAQAQSRQQALEAALDPEATNEAVAEEEDARVKSDTISELAAKMDPTTDQVVTDEYVIDRFGDQYDHIDDIQYDETANTITFTAENPDGGTITVVYDATSENLLSAG